MQDDAKTITNQSEELSIQYPRATGLLLGYIFVLTFVGMAVFHLVDAPWISGAFACSVLWLLLVTVLVVTTCRDAGSLRQFLLNRIGDFARDRFIRVESSEALGKVVRFGYRILGQEFTQNLVQLDGITDVSWYPGQGSSMAGRDMNDWIICISFDSKAVATTQSSWAKRFFSDMYFVQPSGQRAKIEELGREVVEFFRRTGVVLVQTGEREFQRSDLPLEKRREATMKALRLPK